MARRSRTTQAPLERFAHALAQELPEVDAERLCEAVARAAARTQIATTALVHDTAEGEALVDRHLARVATAEDAAERAALLCELGDVLELDMADLGRALSARLGAFAEYPRISELAHIERLARDASCWTELVASLDAVAAMHPDDDLSVAIELTQARAYRHGLGDVDAALRALERARAAAPERPDVMHAIADTQIASGRLRDAIGTLESLVEIAGADAERAACHREMAVLWEELADPERAAECHEWVLAFAPGDDDAFFALERIHGEAGRWRPLIDTLCRRANTVEGDRRADLFVEIAALYEHELDDRDGAIDFHQAADEIAPDRPAVLSALARLYEEREAFVDALAAHERVAALVPERSRRARVLHGAADLAWQRLDDADSAHDLLLRALEADPDFVAAIDGLAGLHRERGQLAAAADLLVRASRRPALTDQRPRLLCDAADLYVALEETQRAIDLYREAYDRGHAMERAGASLVELYSSTGADRELVPLLDELCRSTEDPRRLRPWLLLLGRAASAIGEDDIGRHALARAVTLDPHDHDSRRAFGDLLFEQRAWREAGDILTRLLEDHEDGLPTSDCVELHYRVARCSAELGATHAARVHVATALALDPSHRPSLSLHADLDVDDPMALVADKLAMAEAAPADEKADILAEIGDLYADQLEDAASAREMYREALLHRPTDHILLTKCLDMVAEQGDWSHGMDLLERLIETESTPSIRARYRHVAGMLCRDELDRPETAVEHLWQAIDDAPRLFQAADELEALLERGGQNADRLTFYYRRLDQLREREGRQGERLRLWDRLGEVCMDVGRHEDALCAFEVGLRLAPDDTARRHQLADLYAESGPEHRADAIAHHQAILKANKRRTASYAALQSLYTDAGRGEEARACQQALAIIGMRPVAERNRIPTAKPLVLGADTPSLRAEEWSRLSFDVDRLLSILFSMVAPLLASERIGNRAPHRPSQRTALEDHDPRPFARAFRHVVGVLDVDYPLVHLKREQTAACRIALRADDGLLAPVVTLGRSALDGTADEHALVFTFARRLADLRPERFARLLCPRADELAQIIDSAVELASGDVTTHTGRWLARTLRAVDRDQIATIGARLAERRVDPAPAALAWLEATERAADRVAYILAGDLPRCVRALDGDSAGRTTKTERILDLVWSSVTEEMFAVRRRIERWAGSGHAADTGNPNVA